MTLLRINLAGLVALLVGALVASDRPIVIDSDYVQLVSRNSGNNSKYGNSQDGAGQARQGVMSCQGRAHNGPHSMDEVREALLHAYGIRIIESGPSAVVCKDNERCAQRHHRAHFNWRPHR